MTHCRLTSMTLTLAALVVTAAGLEAQQASNTLVGKVGVHRTAHHQTMVGPALELTFGHATAGRLSHHVGLRLAVQGGHDLECALAPDGGCLNNLSEPVIGGIFYELRVGLADRESRFRPYIGPRGSVIRGWDGYGAGLGVAYGVELKLWGGMVAEIGGTAEYLVTRPLSTHGYRWRGPRAGLGTGLGFGY